MEEKTASRQYGEKSKIYHSPSLNRIMNYSKNNDSDEEQIHSEKNLRNKLDNAFSDLENLRKALKDIKYKTETSFQNNVNILDFNNSSIKNKTVEFSPTRHSTSNVKKNYDYYYERNGGSASRSSSRKKTLNFKEDRKRLLTPKSGSRISTKILFSNLKDNLKESEKILAQDRISNKSIIANSPSTYYIDRRKTRDAQILFDNNLYSESYSNNQDINSSYLNYTSTNLTDKCRSRLDNYYAHLKAQYENNRLIQNRTDSNANNISFSNIKNNLSNLNNNSSVQNIYQRNNSKNSSSRTTNISNTIIHNVSINNIKDENERLKLSNAVLTKSNIDLKNQVRLLQIELNATTPGNLESYTNRLLSEDPKFLSFVDNLKAALANSTNSNQEITLLFENLQKKNAEISKENLILKEQYDLATKELECLTKRISETRFSIDDLNNELRKLENEKTVLILQKNDFEEKYKVAEEKINNLISINESHIKCKNDNLEMIENLKLTIETLRKSSGENDNNKSSMLVKIEELQTLVNEKSYSIESLSKKIQNYENDREYYNQELKIIQKELKDKDKFIENLQQNYHEVNTEYEKAKSRVEALIVNISERDQTISNLKTSISFISGTIEDYKQDYDKIRIQTDGENAEKSKLMNEIELIHKKLNDSHVYNESLKREKEILQKRNLEIETELNDKKINLSKSNFENDVLKQKLDSNHILIDQMQEDMRNSKMLKIHEEFQNEISKSNEERMRRVREIEKQIDQKNKIIEELQLHIQQITTSKEEKINELQIIINSKSTSEKEIEMRMNDQINELKNEIELSKQEIIYFKTEKEKERAELLMKYAKLQSQYEELNFKYREYEKKFQEFLTERFTYGFWSNILNTNSNITDLNKLKFENGNFELNTLNKDKLFNTSCGKSSEEINVDEILKKIRQETEKLDLNSSFDKNNNNFNIQQNLNVTTGFDNSLLGNSFNNTINNNINKYNTDIINPTIAPSLTTAIASNYFSSSTNITNPTPNMSNSNLQFYQSSNNINIPNRINLENSRQRIETIVQGALNPNNQNMVFYDKYRNSGNNNSANSLNYNPTSNSNNTKEVKFSNYTTTYQYNSNGDNPNIKDYTKTLNLNYN